MSKLTLTGTFCVLIGAAIATPLDQSDQSKAVAEGQSNKDVTDRNILKLKQLVNKTIDEQLDILNRAARYRTLSSNHKARVDKIIFEQLGVKPEDVKPESSLINDLGADELDFVELVMAVEEEFDIEIPTEDEAFKLKTVQDVYDMLFV